MNANRTKVLRKTENCSNQESLLEQLRSYSGGKNFTLKQSSGHTIWKVTRKRASNDISNWRITKTDQFYKVSTPCLVDHNFKNEELQTVGEFSKVCCQIVLKCLYLVRIGRPDIRWSVNILAREVSHNGGELV